MADDHAGEFAARIHLYRAKGKRRYRAVACLTMVGGPEPHAPGRAAEGEGASPDVAIRRAVDEALADINRWRRQHGHKVLG